MFIICFVNFLRKTSLYKGEVQFFKLKFYVLMKLTLLKLFSVLYITILFLKSIFSIVFLSIKQNLIFLEMVIFRNQ